MAKPIQILLFRPTFRTWENLVSTGSWDTTSIQECKRIMPHDLTEGIYTALKNWEREFERITLPLYPTRLRLLGAEQKWEADLVDKKAGAKITKAIEKAIEEAKEGWDEAIKEINLETDDVKRFAASALPLGVPTSKILSSFYYRAWGSIDINFAPGIEGLSIEKILGKFYPSESENVHDKALDDYLF